MLIQLAKLKNKKKGKCETKREIERRAEQSKYRRDREIKSIDARRQRQKRDRDRDSKSKLGRRDIEQIMVNVKKTVSAR